MSHSRCAAWLAALGPSVVHVYGPAGGEVLVVGLAMTWAVACTAPALHRCSRHAGEAPAGGTGRRFRSARMSIWLTVSSGMGFLPLAKKHSSQKCIQVYTQQHHRCSGGMARHHHAHLPPLCTPPWPQQPAGHYQASPAPAEGPAPAPCHPPPEPAQPGPAGRPPRCCRSPCRQLPPGCRRPPAPEPPATSAACCARPGRRAAPGRRWPAHLPGPGLVRHMLGLSA